MKILFTNFHKRNGGGHATYIVNLLKRLSPEHECHVATPGSSRLFRFVQQLPHARAIDQQFNSRLNLMLPELCTLRRLIKQEQYDLIHVNASADHRHVMLACLGLKNRPKILFTKHNDHGLNTLGHRLRARATDRVIAVSAFVQALFPTSPYAHLPIDVIYHGVDTDYFCPDPEQRAEDRHRLVGKEHPELILLGSSGGTDWEKGWMEMVEAVSLLPPTLRQQCRIIMAGDPPKQDKLEAVERFGMTSQVVYTGLVDDVRPVLNACDLGFVLSHKEALSFACRESMALGLPTIVSDAGGLPENIQHEINGWIVPARDVKQLTQLLATLLPNPVRCQQIALAARQTAAEEFNLAQFAQHTLLCYKKTLNS